MTSLSGVIRLLVLLALFSGLISTQGCGSGDQVKRASVSGNVTFEGQPVESGIILFIPEPGVVGPPVQIVINNGAYSSEKAAGPAVGANRVQITANRKTGKERLIQGVQAEEIIQFIPEKYNEQTTLSVVVENKANEFNFELTK